jgi:hypothetical protein
MVFTIALEQVGMEYAAMDISDADQSEVNLIIESFRRDDEVAGCLQQGGRWEVLGFSGPGCNLPSSDGGSPCTDIRDCEGLCLADDEEIMVENSQGVLVSDPDRIEEINARGEELEGVCSMWQSDFGCNVVLERGKYVEICVD